MAIEVPKAYLCRPREESRARELIGLLMKTMHVKGMASECRGASAEGTCRDDPPDPTY